GWTGKAGDAAQARDLFAALVTDRARALGPDHPHTLGARREQASWTRQAGSARDPNS
ncbi:tetratricopeptide repeat protein, partial [Streptomyces sp. NPDC017454]